MKGQIIGGTFDEILVRQKQSEPFELGELVICETENEKVLFQVFDICYGSQLSQQNLELISGMYLEEKQPIQLFEKELRNYSIAKLTAVLHISKDHTQLSRSLPPLFGEVRELHEEDLAFMQNQKGFVVGNLRSGKNSLLPVTLPTKETLNHHILIAATTGKGKSNLLQTILYNLIEDSQSAMLVLDPHDEYYGRNAKGLKDHVKWDEHGTYYTATSIPNAHKLSIHISHLRPAHFFGVSDFSQPQIELMLAYNATYQEDWIEAILKREVEKLKFDFREDTFSVVQRRLSQILDISVSDTLVCNGVFDTELGKSTLGDVTKQLLDAKTVIIDTSTLNGQSEMLVSSVLTHTVYNKYRHLRKSGELKNAPAVSIVLEEALRVIGKDVLERGNNIFATIAKEGRKFGVGLCAVTQLPSLIPKAILANMNTKIILGIEMALERNAIIESAAQDLTKYSKTIASLDRGEAIISSNFARFAVPLKIPFFGDVVKQNQENTKEKPTIKLAGI